MPIERALVQGCYGSITIRHTLVKTAILHYKRPKVYTANIYSQTAVEVHSKTCLLSKSTDLWLQFFYKYFIVLVANNNCYYYRYFNAFVNAGKLKCKVQLITALWNTEKLM